LHLLATYWSLSLFCYFYIIYHRMSLDGINNHQIIVKNLEGWPVSSIYPHTWNFTHPYMACTWHVFPFLTFQPPIYGFHLGCILIYGLYPVYVPIHGILAINTWLIPGMCPHAWGIPGFHSTRDCNTGHDQ